MVVLRPSLTRDSTEGSRPRGSFGARVGRSSWEACRFRRIIERAGNRRRQLFSLQRRVIKEKSGKRSNRERSW